MSLLSPIVFWWMKSEAKRHPDKDAQVILDEFLKENGLDTIVTVDDTKHSLGTYAFSKQKLMDKLDKLPEEKKEQIIKSIEAKSGLHIDDIRDEIVVPNITSVALHEAGHIKDFQTNPKGKAFLRKWAPTASLIGQLGLAAGSIVTSEANPKLSKALALAETPMLIGGALPDIIQEAKANRFAYDKLKSTYGEDIAKDKAIHQLAPGMAAHVSGGVVEPWVLGNVVAPILIKKMLKSPSIQKMFEDMESATHR